jgi:hypothetical protein
MAWALSGCGRVGYDLTGGTQTDVVAVAGLGGSDSVAVDSHSVQGGTTTAGPSGGTTMWGGTGTIAGATANHGDAELSNARASGGEGLSVGGAAAGTQGTQSGGTAGESGNTSSPDAGTSGSLVSGGSGGDGAYRGQSGFSGYGGSAGEAHVEALGGTSGAPSSAGTANADAGAAGNGGVPPGGSCDWSNGPPVLGAARSLGAVNTAQSEIDPVVSPDGLTLTFVSYRSARQGNDIYVSTRSSPADEFGAGVRDAASSSTFNDTHLFVGPDGLEAFVSSDRTGTMGQVDIFRATRGSPSDAWGAYTPVAEINSVEGDFDPHLEADRLTLWFDPVGRVEGSGLQDLFYARRADPSAPFGAPIPATSLNSTANDWDVSLTADGRVIVFQSDRDASRHVYYAVRSSRTVDFGAPTILAALDPYMSTLSDPFVASDGCAVYFSAALSGGAGANDLNVAEAVP